MTDVIEYIHGLGITHRDLKLENFLLDNNMEIKLADFGFSRFFEKSQILKTACGSPHYASPEVIAQNGYTAEKSDIWSLGVCLFKMVTGIFPFEDPDISTLYSIILFGDFETPRDIPKGLK